MKLERNKNSYQVMDKSIDEINKDLETVDISIGILNFNQKLLHLTAACWLTASALNTMLYVKNNKNEEPELQNEELLKEDEKIQKYKEILEKLKSTIMK